MIRPTASWIRTLVCAAAFAAVPACSGQKNNNPTVGPTFGGLLSVTATGGGNANLVWSPAVDTVGGGTITYNIFGVIGSLPADSGKEVFIIGVTNPTGYTLSGLTPDPWVFYVQAVDSFGNPDGNNPPTEIAATIT